MVDVIRERSGFNMPGLVVLPFMLAGLVAGPLLFVSGPRLGLGVALAGIVIGIGAFILARGLFVVQPNQARVLQLFGRYAGTVRTAGLRFTNPFYTKRAVSVRVRNFESDRVKVNDAEGNPVEIAAVVVWRVDDSAEALFHVDSYEHFVEVQSEAALRNLATRYPYDAHTDGAISLRSHAQTIAEQLAAEIQARLEEAGIQVIEARISHLAYAPEIAGAMLQRQQASAIVAARETIVDGAVGMVDMALEQLTRQQIVDLDDESRAALASNLLIVLCSDNPAQPVLPTAAPRRSRTRGKQVVAA